jgi:hypothetical protein
MSYEDRLVTKRYLVTGKRKYRWHEPGTEFEAALDPAAEKRAIERGSIRVLAIVHPELQNGSYALPEDWPHDAVGAAQSEAQQNASRVK